jgi:hypothetical protein
MQSKLPKTLPISRAIWRQTFNKALKRTAKRCAFCSLRFAAAARLASRYSPIRL